MRGVAIPVVELDQRPQNRGRRLVDSLRQLTGLILEDWYG